MGLWSKSKGQSLVEVLIAMGISAILLPALLTGFIAAREGRPQMQQRSEALGLLNEADEVVRMLRNAGWQNISTNGIYHPVLTGGIWSLVAGTQTLGDFQRQVEIADTFRDTNGQISDTGTVDPSTKKITTTVSWSNPIPASVGNVFYLTRYRDNLTYLQSTEAHFLAGVHTGTTTQNSSGGEIILGSGGSGNWCAPDLAVAQLDLPKNGVANALTAIEGQVFAGTGENASGVSFAEVALSNTNPPVASINGTFDGYKTNSVFGEENYAYLATDTNSSEIAILDLSTNPLTSVGSFDAPGSADANSITVSGTVGYMTQGNVFRTFDLTSKAGSRPALGSVNLAGVGTKVVVSGTYAYVSISGSNTKLQIINVSNPASLSIVGQSILDSGSATGLFVNNTATRAYLVTQESSTQREFFVIDITSKSGNQPMVGSFDTLGMSPKGVVAVPGNRAIVVGINAEEYQVINLSNETTPVRCGGVEVNAGINGIDTVLEQDGDAYSYIITGDASSELKIIPGGPGGQYSTAGTFESDFFDPGYVTAFNRIEMNYQNQPNTQTQVQLAVADAVSGNCSEANYVFVGPDGTSSTFYTTTSAIYLNDDNSGYENPGRCFKYRVYLTTSDISQTPQFNDMTINFSP